jgi:hypothetical protein
LLILKSQELEDVTQETISVENRQTLPGEDLSAYDKVIVFIAPHDSIAAGYRWGGLWALAARPDAIVAVDDWQYYTIQMKLASALAAGRFYRFVYDMPNWSRKEEVAAFTDEIAEKIKNLAKSMCHEIPFKNVLMPLFTWHDQSKIGFRITNKEEKIVPIDPSRFIELESHDCSQKAKQWVCGSLFDHSAYMSKLDLKWPIVKVGHKKTQRVLSEADLCKLYANSLGIISPKYRTSGDGWWRMRYVHAAKYCNILCLSPQEATKMHWSFKTSGSCFERLTDYEIIRNRNNQVSWLRENFESKKSVLTKIAEVLK